MSISSRSPLKDRGSSRGVHAASVVVAVRGKQGRNAVVAAEADSDCCCAAVEGVGQSGSESRGSIEGGGLRKAAQPAGTAPAAAVAAGKLRRQRGQILLLQRLESARGRQRQENQQRRWKGNLQSFVIPQQQTHPAATCLFCVPSCSEPLAEFETAMLTIGNHLPSSCERDWLCFAAEEPLPLYTTALPFFALYFFKRRNIFRHVWPESFAKTSPLITPRILSSSACYLHCLTELHRISWQLDPLLTVDCAEPVQVLLRSGKLPSGKNEEVEPPSSAAMADSSFACASTYRSGSNFAAACLCFVCADNSPHTGRRRGKSLQLLIRSRWHTFAGVIFYRQWKSPCG